MFGAFSDSHLATSFLWTGTRSDACAYSGPHPLSAADERDL